MIDYGQSAWVTLTPTLLVIYSMKKPVMWEVELFSVVGLTSEEPTASKIRIIVPQKHC